MTKRMSDDVPVRIETQLTYVCAAPDCRIERAVPVTDEERRSWTHSTDYELENLPGGWALFVINAAGVTGHVRLTLCSADCVTDVMDRSSDPSITRYMRGY